jgi:hypothetical protein
MTNQTNVTPDDLKQLSVALAALRTLLDSPAAIMERARALLHGTAEPLV